MESSGSKVQLDVIVDHGDGLYEAHVFLRRPGVFTVCADTVASYANNTDPKWAKRHDARFTREAVAGFPAKRFDTTGKVVHKGSPTFCHVEGSWAAARCAKLTVDIPSAAVARLESVISAQRVAQGPTGSPVS
jgi:hypothetical protein